MHLRPHQWNSGKGYGKSQWFRGKDEGGTGYGVNDFWSDRDPRALDLNHPDIFNNHHSQKFYHYHDNLSSLIIYENSS